MGLGKEKGPESPSFVKEAQASDAGGGEHLPTRGRGHRKARADERDGQVAVPGHRGVVEDRGARAGSPTGGNPRQAELGAALASED